MDIFEGSVDPTGARQIRDFNPGITARGLFWTDRLHSANVVAEPHEGRAELRIEDFLVPDFHDILSALKRAAPVTMGTLDLRLRWHGGGRSRRVDDHDNDFSGRFVPGPASVWFHVRADDGFSYTSARDGQKVVFAEVGRERNGSFHH